MVKRILIVSILVLVLVSCKKNNLAVMDFDETEHDFGTIKEGQTVENQFKFTNSGKSDLIITNAQASCGCTVAEYPKDAVKPNQEGIIKVKFSSEGKHGKQEKSITISANTENRKEMLKIYADIK